MSSVDCIPASTEVDYDPFAGEALARVVPTTEPQREIWLAAQLEPDASLAYNESISLRLSGALDVAALRAALQALVDRHEALRSSFSEDGEQLHIAEHGELPCPVRDLSSLNDADREAEIAGTLARAVETPFDLENGPLARAELLCLSPRTHLLVLTSHHIVCDGWSFGVLVRDLAALYEQQTGIGDAKLGPADSFADFALAEVAHADSEARREADDYWLKRFEGTPPTLDLPVDRARTPQRTFHSRREDRTLDEALVTGIRSFGAKHGVSLYATLLTGFGVLLARLGADNDIVIGIPAAGQAAGGHDSLVGHCVNVLPLRATIDPETEFSRMLDRVRGDLLDAFEHQRYTFGHLLKRLSLARDPSRLPLIGVLFNLDQALDEKTVSFGELEFEFSGNPRLFENFELFVNAVQVDGQLRLECQYNSDLFDAASVRRWLEGYETLLRAIVADGDPITGQLPIVSQTGIEHLRALQPAPTPFDRDARIPELIFAQRDRAPENVAIRCGATCWTYAELQDRTHAITQAIRAHGVAPGSLVGICLERSPDMIAAVIGVLAAGAAYVPLDPSYPLERLNFMAQDAGLALLINQASTAAAIDWPQEQSLSLDEELNSREAVTPPDPQLATGGDDIAYVIYTSGSTGKPKGVCVPHRAVVNFLTSMQREPGLVQADRLLAITTLSFDIAVLELLLPLSAGAEVVLATREQTQDGHALSELLDKGAATVMQATPASWRMLIETGWKGNPTLKALCGGEALTPDLAADLLPRVGALWNMYGPTETTVWSTCIRVEQAQHRISIGRPIANTTVWILDAQGRTCPIGVPGEICIGGDGVTLDYLHRPELTAERFIPDQFSQREGARLYRTGDRGRWSAQGTLEHLGRLDFQIKLRGHRIELGEIETRLGEHADVNQTVVIVREDRPGDQRLVAYVVATPEKTPDVAGLRAHLRQCLPDYMVPQHFVVLDSLPRLPNGKIDRKSLRPPQAQTDIVDSPHIAPRNELEQRVARAMEQTLSLPDIGVDDDFFAVGGHSLLAAHLTAKLNQEFDITLSLRQLFDTPTVAGLTLVIADETSRDDSATGKISPRADQMRAPLSLLQKRLWLFEELNPGSVVYNTPSAHRLCGHLDEAAFTAAFNDLVQRQASLRTSIEREGAEAIQIVRPHVDVALFPAEDLGDLGQPERETELMRRLEALTNTPFDLAVPPLFRVHMFRLGPEEHVLFFMPHHIIWDGWSFDLFYEAFSRLYAAREQGHAASAPVPSPTYADFADWHGGWIQSNEYAEQFRCALERWKKLLTQRGPPPFLPADKPRKKSMSSAGQTEWISLPKALTDDLREVGRQADGTLYMVLLAAYYALLWRVVDDGNLVVGTPVRVRASADVEKIMGLFTSLLPLPLELESSLSFAELIARVRTTVLDGFATPDVQIEDLMREPGMRELAGTTHFYQAQFSYQDARDRICKWGGLTQRQVPLFQRDVSEDLTVWLLENAQGMIGGVLYNAEIFHTETAQLLARRYVELLQDIASNPERSISDLTSATPAEIERVRAWNSTDTDIPKPARIEELFEACVDRAPEKIALTSGSWGTSYAEIEQRANRIAACLRERGVSTGTVVGLCSDTGTNRLAGMLAVFKTGGICVPIDSSGSVEGFTDIVEDAGISVLLGESTLPAATSWPRERALWFDADTAEIIAASSARGRRDEQGGSQTPAIAVYDPSSANEPSGVAFTHPALANLLTGLRQALELDADHRILGTASPASPLGIIECLLPLSIGAEFIEGSPREVAGGEAMAKLATSSEASVMFAPPETWRSMISSGWEGATRMKAVCVSNVPDRELAETLATGCGELWTTFGSNDTSIIATCGRIERPADGIHNGRPLANTTAWVLDEQNRPCPIGAIGEICIGGMSLARNFGQRAGSADERALSASWSNDAESKLIRTGLRGRWRIDGNLESIPLPAERLADIGAPRSLPEADQVRNTGAPPPMTTAERYLADIWQELLGVHQVLKTDNFFDLGGHSLLAVTMAARVEKRTRVRLNLLKIANSSLGALAGELPQTIADSDRSTVGKRMRGLFGLERKKNR